MSLDELEKIAANGLEMPSGLNSAEQMFFQSLRHVYTAYRSGKLPRDAAKREKKEIQKQYEVNSLDLRCWENARKRESKLSVISPDLKASGCEICRKYADILAGLGDGQ